MGHSPRDLEHSSQVARCPQGRKVIASSLSIQILHSFWSFNFSFSSCTGSISEINTVKFINFRTLENFAVIYLKFGQLRPNLRVFCQNDANEIAKSEDPDQTAPIGAV